MTANMTVSITGEQINGTALSQNTTNGDKDFRYNGELFDYLDHNNVRIAILVFYLSTFVFGLLGNGLVLYIISHFSKVRTKSVANYYIWNLSLADLLFCFALPFFAFSTYTRHWPFGSVCCKLGYLLRDMNKFTSVFTLCALSIDRYIATFYHLAYLRTIQVGKFVCVAIWIVSLIISTPYLIFAEADESGNGRERCGLVWPKHNKLLYMRFWTYFQLLIGLIGPTVMLSTSYGLLIRRFVFMMKQQHKNQIKKSGRRMTQTVIAIVVIFLICQTPYYVVQIISLQKAEKAAAYTLKNLQYIPSDHEVTSFVYLNAVAQILVFFSSCSNPIIYALLNENFRKYFWIMSYHSLEHHFLSFALLFN